MIILKTKDYSEWQEWIAWHPVSIFDQYGNEHLVWFERIRRRFVYDIGEYDGYWVYDFLPR